MNIQAMAKQMNDVEPAFNLRWDGSRAAYFVDKPDIGDTAVYTAEQIASLQQQLAAAREALGKISRVAETGTVESFLALSDDDKRKWFAMALDESTRRKRAEELLDSGCIVTHDRDEFGEEQRTLRCGLNLREAIKSAMDEVEVYESIKTLQRDRQP